MNRPDALKAFFAVRGRMALIARELGIHPATVTKWPYIPEIHVREVSRLTGVPQRDLPRKGQ